MDSASTHGENPSVWVVEFFLTPFDLFVYTGPEESAVPVLSAGEVIGFSCLVHDADGGSLFTENFNRFLLPAMSLDAHFENAHTADSFADAVLLGAEGTAVEDLTWGRIKGVVGQMIAAVPVRTWPPVATLPCEMSDCDCSRR